jgi:hypothetical protein
MYPGFPNMSMSSLNVLAEDFDPLPEHHRPNYRSTSLDPNFRFPNMGRPGIYDANYHVQTSLPGNGNGAITSPSAFDPFVAAPSPMTPGAVGPVSANPYAHDPTAMGGAFFANQAGFQQPVSASGYFRSFRCSRCSRFSTIFMLPLALIIRTLWDISEMSMICSSLTTSVKNCRRKLRLLCRPFPVS